MPECLSCAIESLHRRQHREGDQVAQSARAQRTAHESRLAGLLHRGRRIRHAAHQECHQRGRGGDQAHRRRVASCARLGGHSVRCGHHRRGAGGAFGCIDGATVKSALRRSGATAGVGHN